MATASDDNVRCAQCTFVVLNIFPKMMQDLLASTNETPLSLYNKVMKNTSFRRRLNSSEMDTLQTMATHGYTKLDVSFMYKMIKFFKLIDPPTRNWGSNPLTDENELGDDIERIRRSRNYLVHKFDANISEQSYIDFFENIAIVSRRLDTYLKKPEGMGYENMIQEWKLSSLDSKDKERLLDERKEEECLKKICTCTPSGKETEIHVFSGKTMDEVIENVKSVAGDYVTPIKIIIHGIDDSEDKVELINSLKSMLSNDNITVKGAEKNCIIIFAEAKAMMLQDYSLFLKEINCLIEKVFRSCNLTCKADKKTYAVVTSAEEEFDHDDMIESVEGGPSIFGDDDSFTLHVDIKNNSFASGERVDQAFSEFFDNIAELGNGQKFFAKKTVHAILIPERNDGVSQFDSRHVSALIPANDNSDEPKMKLSNEKMCLETDKSKDIVNQFDSNHSTGLIHVPTRDNSDGPEMLDTDKANTESPFQGVFRRNSVGAVKKDFVNEMSSAQTRLYSTKSYDVCRERHAKLGCMVLMLFPKAMQMILKYHIPPRGLKLRYLRKDFRFTLTTNEDDLMEKLPSVDGFTIELCYKILRHEILIDEPKCKWGNVPHDTEVELTDDIQRLINATNSILSIRSEDVTEINYKHLLGEIKLMVSRIDSFLHQDALISMYNSLGISKTDSISILQDLTKIGCIQEYYHSLFSGKENGNRYQILLMAIIDTFPNIIRNVIKSRISARQLYSMYSERSTIRSRLFLSDQQAEMKTLKFDYANTYSSLSFEICYKLLRELNLVQPPTKGWGFFPDRDYTNLGDDIERIRCYRNQLVHRHNTYIDTNEFNNYFDKFREIGRRMDLHFNSTHYERDIIDYKASSIDGNLTAKFENVMKHMENMKLRFEKRPIKFYWGDNFDSCLLNLKSLIKDEQYEGRQKVCLQIIFQNANDLTGNVEILNSLKEEINNGLTGIEFIVASKETKEEIKKQD